MLIGHLSKCVKDKVQNIDIEKLLSKKDDNIESAPCHA